MNLHMLDHIKDLPAYVETLSPTEKKTVLQYLQAVEQYKENNKIQFFEPDDWQKRAIHLGSTEQHRMVCAGNR